nr:serine/threonine protein phosphatase [Desulfobulbaceae bacterium]
MKLKDNNGILYPRKMKIGNLIVTGTPGSGKSYLIGKIGGWPGEVGIDISQNKWWTVEPLSHRPREVHFSFPFVGGAQSHTVYDECWETAAEFPEVDWEKIQIPKKKTFIFAANWRARFVFDFILPPSGWIIKQREKRLASADKRVMDM